MEHLDAIISQLTQARQQSIAKHAADLIVREKEIPVTPTVSRFDLEAAVDNMWGVLDILKLLSKSRGGDADVDAVIRIATLQVNSLSNIYEQLVDDDKIL